MQAGSDLSEGLGANAGRLKAAACEEPPTNGEDQERPTKKSEEIPKIVRPFPIGS